MKNNMKRTFAGLATAAVMAASVSGGAVFADSAETTVRVSSFREIETASVSSVRMEKTELADSRTGLDLELESREAWARETEQALKTEAE